MGDRRETSVLEAREESVSRARVWSATSNADGRSTESRTEKLAGHVEITGDFDKSSFTGVLETNAGLEQCTNMGAEEVETTSSRNCAIKEAEKRCRHWTRGCNQGRIFLRLGAVRPCVYAGQNNLGEEIDDAEGREEGQGV